VTGVPAAVPTPETSPSSVSASRGVRGRRESRADVRRQRLVDAQLGPDPAAADDVPTTDPRSLRERARSLWCTFVSGLG
jgi:hypothetical protein